MPTSSALGACAGGQGEDCRKAAVVVRQGDPDARRGVALVAQERKWPVVALYGTNRDDHERMLLGAHAGIYSALVIRSLADLGATPGNALATVEIMAALGVAVVSQSEPWLASSLAAVAHTARWLDAANKSARAQKIKEAMARNNRRPGRPRRVVPVADAQRLLRQGMTVGGAARALGVPETTLRRAISEHTAEERLATLVREVAT